MSERETASHDGFDAEVESLLLPCLQRPTAEWEPAVERLCAERPDLAPRIRPLFERMRSLDGESWMDAETAAGHTIGPYRILEKLGEGGMGTVFLAEQRDPVTRRVALKLIKPGMDSKQVLARFDAERAALGLMDHPGIARVLDAGATKRGLPYFVMEHVPGVPITDYCDRQKLDIEERLRLFADVARALQHAHQKGVIHRDVKPSNILVRVQDGRPVPKIIDFGIAKATNHRLTEQTLFTEQGAIVGTPEYMSPEQAEMSALDVDTRTDIYSLGAMLYELLVGRLPFEAADLRRGGFIEIIRTIREVDPPKPSTRLTTCSDATEHAARRRTDLGSLQTKLTRDLDWVVMKALEKDPARRYQSASELAADIERFLKSEPVEARAPSALYRLRKLARRHRAEVAAGLFVVIALVAGIVSTTFFALREARLAEQLAARAGELGLMAHPALLRLATAEEEQLHPAWPSAIPELESWLERHAGAMAQALPEVRARIAELAAGRSTWQRNEALRHEMLTQLAGDIDRFEADTVRDVRESLAWARSLAAREADPKHRALWDRAIRAVRTSATYGFELAPQHGLVPLGPDPKTGLEEFAHLRSGSLAARENGTGSLEPHERTGIVFVLLPRSQPLLGAQSQDADGAAFDRHAHRNEGPPHVVKLDPFFLAKRELTQAQWMALSGGANPSHNKPGMDEVTLASPVERVTWNACDGLLRRHGLTLPTEAQWEYACRARTTTPWWTGAERESLRLRRAVNIADATARDAKAPFRVDDGDLRDGFALHAPVHLLRPNPFGFQGMHGNVGEWCRDRYGTYELPFAPGDAERQVPAERDDGTRVFRGGTFSSRALDGRTCRRRSAPPTVAHDNIGVRPARRIHP